MNYKWICPSCKQIILDNPEVDKSIESIYSSIQLPKGQEFTEEELKLEVHTYR